MDYKDLKEKIGKLKKERDAIILAHNYQIAEVQDIADFLGDSFDLAQKAALVKESTIIFCGVYFMAESAKILAADKTVILPALDAGCTLADMATAEAVKEMRAKHPQAAAVAYVNTSAAVKAEVDVCCTSSNALKVVESLPNEEIIFLPDKNLGQYIASQTSKKMIIWPGYCATHDHVSLGEVEEARRKYPAGLLLVHPESNPEVVAQADYAGGTAGILKYVKESKAQTFIIGTEIGILHRLKKENPTKDIHILSPKLLCPDMKKITLEKIYQSLVNFSPIVDVPLKVADKARQSLERMLAIK